MSHGIDAPTTTSRRTWRLLRTLALPWVVCGGLLWALVGLTPHPMAGTGGYPDAPIDFAVNIERQYGNPFGTLWIVWNPRDSPNRTQTGILIDVKGLFAAYGSGRAGGWWVAWIAAWWLLPFPLLWSCFNLFRWVRRGSMR